MKFVVPTLAFLAVISYGHAAALSPTHPIIGSWHVHVPGTTCSETYVFKPNGTTWVQSADEISESKFEISAAPDADGYYRLTDTIVTNNRKPDCRGELTTIGDTVTVFVLFNNVSDHFLFCPKHVAHHCVGPFIRALSP